MDINQRDVSIKIRRIFKFYFLKIVKGNIKSKLVAKQYIYHAFIGGNDYNVKFRLFLKGVIWRIDKERQFAPKHI